MPGRKRPGRSDTCEMDLKSEEPFRKPDRSLGNDPGPLGDSCGNPKLSRRDANHPLEVKGKLALVREAWAQRGFRQAETAICLQEMLSSFKAACDHILVRRQSDGRLELAELPARKCAVRPSRRPMHTRGV
jgi:hypothetical protein